VLQILEEINLLCCVSYNSIIGPYKNNLSLVVNSYPLENRTLEHPLVKMTHAAYRVNTTVQSYSFQYHYYFMRENKGCN
jgi:hypothetical protein